MFSATPLTCNMLLLKHTLSSVADALLCPTPEPAVKVHNQLEHRGWSGANQRTSLHLQHRQTKHTIQCRQTFSGAEELLTRKRKKKIPQSHRIFSVQSLLHPGFRQAVLNTHEYTSAPPKPALILHFHACYERNKKNVKGLQMVGLLL